MENTEIGIATLEYDDKGNFIAGSFTPIGTQILPKEMAEFGEVSCESGEEKIKEQACNVFAAWFQKMNDIELADREEYKIESDLAQPSEFYPSGGIKKCYIKFTLKKIA